jgi:hypothetical protein
MKYVFSDLREFLAIPIFLIAGYVLLPNPKWAGRYANFMTVAGIGTAAVLLWHFGSTAEEAGFKESINVVRQATYNGAYAGLSAGMLSYLFVTRQTRVPGWLLVVAAGFCVAGITSPLTRSDWLLTFGCLCSVLVIVPRERRATAGLLMGFTVIGVILAILIGVHFADALMHKDFGAMLVDRAATLNPFSEGGKEGHAWDTRVGAYWPELEMWFANPLMGSGFGCQWKVALSVGGTDVAFKHNGWSSLLAQCGVFGFLGCNLMPLAMIFLGYRTVRERVDRGTVLLGAYAMMTGLAFAVYSLSTIAFSARNAPLLGIVCGMLFRCRDMRATTLAQFEGYLDIPGPGEPAFATTDPLVPDDLIQVEPFVH